MEEGRWRALEKLTRIEHIGDGPQRGGKTTREQKGRAHRGKARRRAGAITHKVQHIPYRGTPAMRGRKGGKYKNRGGMDGSETKRETSNPRGIAQRKIPVHKKLEGEVRRQL